MENKQTAVTELKAILKSQLVASIFERVEHFIDKAIILEREQIEEAYQSGGRNALKYPRDYPRHVTKEDYYTQTYLEPTKN